MQPIRLDNDLKRPLRIAKPFLASALVSLLVLGGITQRSDGMLTTKTMARVWTRCQTHPRGVQNLRASRLTCIGARKAIKRGKFEVTPGGQLFSTRGFHCESPVGPPRNGPRFTHCRKGHRAFSFYGPSE